MFKEDFCSNIFAISPEKRAHIRKESLQYKILTKESQACQYVAHPGMKGSNKGKQQYDTLEMFQCRT